MELKLEQQLKKGALEMVPLSLIARQRSYGYELISRLQREGGGLFQETKEGTLYPILYRLEDEGLIESELASDSGRRVKKYYQITDLGLSALTERKSFWQSYKKVIDRLLEDAL